MLPTSGFRVTRQTAFTGSPRVVRAVDPQHLQLTTNDLPQSWVGSRVMDPPVSIGLNPLEGLSSGDMEL